MEKKKPTIDEIYKLNVDGLFESTANWFDSAYQKSQAEINKDLYNRINNYTSSGESTGGNVNLGGLLTSLNNSNLYPSKGYLYYNGTAWEFNTPVISGGGTIDESAISIAVNNILSKTTWWGQTIANNKVDGPIKISNGTNTFTIEVDSNGDLKFNGNIYATGGVTALGVGTTTGGGSGASLGTLLTKLNSDNPFPTANGQVLTYDGSNFVWKTSTGSGVTLNPTMAAMNNQLGKTKYDTPQFLYWDGTTYTWKNESEISGGGGGSIQVAQTPEYAGGSENWVSTTKLRFVGITGTKPTIRTNSEKSCVDVGIPIGGGSGSSGTTTGKLRFYQNGSEEAWNGESDFKIIFGSGINVTWDSHSQITLSATGGSSGGSSGGSVSWSDVTNKPSTFTPSSHTHSTNDISGLSSYVQNTKVSNADKADRLSNAVTLWGNSFSGNNNIGTSSSYADLQYVKNIYAGSTFDIEADKKSLLKASKNSIFVGFGYMDNANASLSLFGYQTTIYTNYDYYRYDFKSNVFDVNTNAIHFGSGASGGKISWDRTNNAFKIEGNVYATGGITALGVSNNATTSNNVDFTFKSVTADSATFDKLYLRKEYGYGLFVGTKCALWGAIETDAIHIGGNFAQVYMTEWIVINSNSKQCYCATRLQTAKGLSLLDGYLDVAYNGTTYKFDFAKAKELGLLINTGVKTLSDEVDYANIIQ